MFEVHIRFDNETVLALNFSQNYLQTKLYFLITFPITGEIKIRPISAFCFIAENNLHSSEYRNTGRNPLTYIKIERNPL